MTAVVDRVYETITTTGTGNLSLAGAITGFRAFSSVYANGDTCYYAVEAVDGSGVPTGEWETGLGTYNTSGNTLSRTTVHASSNAGAAVNFSAGTKRVSVSVTKEAAGLWTYAFLGSDSSSTSTTPANVTGLSFTPAANKRYEFCGILSLLSVATTTGVRPGLTWPTGATSGGVLFNVPQSTTATFPAGGDISAEVTAATTNFPSTTIQWPATFAGTILMGGSPSGNVQVRLSTEIGGNAVTVKAGSWIKWREIS